MPDPWKPKPKEVLQKWLDYVAARNKELSTWERDFLANIQIRLFREGVLSQGQEEALDRIYTKTK